jgi:hypothetical protein
MAWDFGSQIHALTGFDADSTSTSDVGDTYAVLATQWLTDAAKEIINILPERLLAQCMTTTTLNSSNLYKKVDMDTLGSYYEVLRNDGTRDKLCRKIPGMYKGSSDDATNLIYYGTSTDPVYWIFNNTLEIFPTPTDSQVGTIHHVQNPSVSYDDSSISRFPNEAEQLVVLRAAVTAAEFQLAIDEDVELHSPIIGNLRQQYQIELQMLTNKSVAVPKQGEQ